MTKIVGSIQQYRSLPRKVYIVFVASTVNAFGNFVYPLLALILSNKLDYSVINIGTVVLITRLAFNAGSLIGGRFADRVSRKIQFVSCRFISAILIFLCILFDVEWIIYLIIIGDFFDGMAHPAYNALIADITDDCDRSNSYSLFFLGTNLGSAVGFMIVGYLSNNINMIFLIDSVTTVISGILILIFISSHVSSESQKGSQNAKVRIEFDRTLRYIFIFVIMSAVFTFSFTQTSFTLPLYIDSLSGANNVRLYGRIMGLNSIIIVVFTPIITTLTAKLNEQKNILIGSVFLCLGYLVISLSTLSVILMSATLIWTIGVILINTNQRIFLANNTPTYARGRLYSMYSLIYGGINSVSPQVSSLIITYFGLRQTFVFSAAATLFIGILILYSSRVFNKTCGILPNTE